ncbi:hypothetical protein HYH03_018919 [Edaphochlamys debaryana]|uniref:DUF1995 domain-containing protein n=1 Tax=Edaphochlamys debaryana TaxID=47281 RepID=A0A835XDR2_9CHLO|nr:hypothetical protein HYH03_018919 [Edaphochlamys debaryana]|eukprot:KAG2482133.1 hypothetical protein HYH03_018919 [Edaphochlamys debaryana]
MKLVHHAPFSSSSAPRPGSERRCAAPARVPIVPAIPCPSPSPSPSPAAASPAARLRAAAAPPAAPSGGGGRPTVVPLPASQQEAVDAAAGCLVPALTPLLAATKPAKTAKGFSNASRPSASNRFGLEIPLADASPAASLALTGSVLAAVQAGLKGRGGAAAAAGAPGNWTVVHAREDVAAAARTRAAASGAAGTVLGLRAACQAPALGGLLLLVEPGLADVALMEQLLDEVWAGPAAVVLNPEWAQQGKQVPPEYAAVVGSVDVVYAFLPCAIQGLIGTKEGAVLRTAEGGAKGGKGAPWRILLQEKDQFMQVGAMTRRPTPSDLELAFLNASAAASPLTKAAKFVKGLVPGDKKKK